MVFISCRVEKVNKVRTAPTEPEAVKTAVVKPLEIPHGEKPKRIKYVEPKYPKEARDKFIMGTVVININIDELGKVTRADVINGNPILVPAAVKAVKAWVYEPYAREGKKIPVRFTEVVRFSSPGRKR
jgi:protein TonB